MRLELSNFTEHYQHSIVEEIFLSAERLNVVVKVRAARQTAAGPAPGSSWESLLSTAIRYGPVCSGVKREV
jgi:hypothetical protein